MYCVTAMLKKVIVIVLYFAQYTLVLICDPIRFQVGWLVTFRVQKLHHNK